VFSDEKLHLRSRVKSVAVTVWELENDPNLHFNFWFHRWDSVGGRPCFFAGFWLGYWFETLGVGVQSCHGRNGLGWHFYVGISRVWCTRGMRCEKLSTFRTVPRAPLPIISREKQHADIQFECVKILLLQVTYCTQHTTTMAHPLCCMTQPPNANHHHTLPFNLHNKSTQHQQFMADNHQCHLSLQHKTQDSLITTLVVCWKNINNFKFNQSCLRIFDCKGEYHIYNHRLKFDD